jgi:sporulation protein YlmC with PRC-barrel domain
MRSNVMMTPWKIAVTGTVAVLGLGSVSLAQSNHGSGTMQAGRAEPGMNAPQVAMMLRDAKQSLAASIGLAEKHCGGRAVRAECCNHGAAAGTAAMCKVTMLVGQDRLVEATVNTQTGEVVSQRDIDGLRSFGGYNNDFAMARGWQKATDLTGKKVTNDMNEDLGKIEDIVVDANSGRILYGVLSFGGVLGMGDKLFAIPWQALPLSTDHKMFVLNVDKDRLKNATSFDKKQWPNFADEQFSTTTYKYYNQTPYWNLHNAAAQPVSGNESRLALSHRDRWNQRTTAWQKASDLCGKDVRNNQNEDLGELSDLAIDPQSGRVLYGILSSRGKLFAVPWPALSLSPDFKQFVLNVSKDQLKDSVSFGKDNWPNMADQRWSSETHAYYNVAPYWADVQAEGAMATP